MSNDFQGFAIGGGANTLTPTAWATLTALLANGFQSGVASSQQVNTALRQSTSMAAAIGGFISNWGYNAQDNGNIVNLTSAFQNALTSGWNLPKFIGNPGYITFPGGLILQFGTASSASSSGAITFPVAFPNSCFMRLVANSNSNIVTPTPDSLVLASWNALGNSGFNWECTNANTNTLTNPGEFIWLAIGY